MLVVRRVHIGFALAHLGPLTWASGVHTRNLQKALGPVDPVVCVCVRVCVCVYAGQGEGEEVALPHVLVLSLDSRGFPVGPNTLRQPGWGGARGPLPNRCVAKHPPCERGMFMSDNVCPIPLVV